MRKLSFVIFFTIALSVYALINFYVALRAWETLSSHPGLRTPVLTILCFLAASFVAGRILERRRITWFSTTLVWIGSFWLAAMTYFLLSLLVIDTARLSNFFLPWFPAFVVSNIDLSKLIVGSLVTLGVIVVVIGGHLNAIRPRIRTLELAIAKKRGSAGSLNIVAASDIHLGTIISKTRLQKIVRMMNELRPDVVLLPGDVFDEDIGPVIRQNLGETLRTIQSKYGVYAITGNHEYIGGEEAACQYLTEHGITVLRDDFAKIDDICYVVGREDISIRQFTGKRRKPLEEVMKSIDRTLPVILMDHQPFHLEEAEQNGVDLQLSGHTHHGQLWPFNYISSKIFELSWGYKKKGNTHIYVSCGVGTWGPPVRTGNTPEILNIRLAFN
ncbi:MAG TPA: metallophosphoesterase [Bacteroidota bacterium]